MMLHRRPGDWAGLTACDHVVQLYDTDHALLDLLQGYVADALHQGHAAIVIATQRHLALLGQALQRDDGLDVVAARWQGQYLPMDAYATLSQFMIGGTPDAELFTRTMEGVLARARRNDRQVRAFGEMVSLLWGDGLPDATVQLEQLWDDFCRRKSVPLLCAYPRDGFTEGDAVFEAICRTHSRLLAA